MQHLERQIFTILWKMEQPQRGVSTLDEVDEMMVIEVEHCCKICFIISSSRQTTKYEYIKVLRTHVDNQPKFRMVLFMYFHSLHSECKMQTKNIQYCDCKSYNSILQIKMYGNKIDQIILLYAITRTNDFFFLIAAFIRGPMKQLGSILPHSK